MTDRDLEIELSALRAELATVKTDRDAARTELHHWFGCSACGERHPNSVMCPPHEMRTTGQAWFHERLAEAKRREDDLQAKLAESEAARLNTEAACANMRLLLAWAHGWLNTEAVMSGLKRGDNSAIDDHLDWLERVDVALSTDAGKPIIDALEAARRLRKMDVVKLSIEQAQLLYPLFAAFDAAEAKMGGRL